MERRLVIYSLRPSPSWTLVASRRRLLLQGKSDTLRTREGVPGPPGAGGRSFASYRVRRVGGYFFKSGDLPRGACLLGWEQGVSGRVLTRTEVGQPGREPGRSLEVCLARLQGRRVGYWPPTGLGDRWLAVSSPDPKPLAPGRRSSPPGPALARVHLHRGAERRVGRASFRVVPSEPGLR